MKSGTEALIYHRVTVCDVRRVTTFCALSVELEGVGSVQQASWAANDIEVSFGAMAESKEACL
jgi:hypothetical protein